MARTLNSTTLSAAVSLDEKRVTLASNSTVKVGHILFVDREALLVNGPGAVGNTLASGDVAEVQRGYAGTAPATHSSGALVYTGAGSDFSWNRPKPGGSVDTNVEAVLPRVVLPDGEVFTVVDSKWVRVSSLPADAQPKAIHVCSANGAMVIADGIHKITKAGVCALTLAAPTAAQEGTRLTVISNTANAHTITATSLLQDGITGGAKTTATFAAFLGASIELVAINLTWSVVNKNVVTIT